MTDDDPLTQARLLLDLEQWTEALGAATDALTVDPDSPHALCITAVCQGHLGRAAEGLAAADRAAQLSPADDWPQRIRASLFGELGRGREALQAAREAVRLAPGVPDCWYLLVRSLVSLPAGVTEAKAAVAYALPYFPDAPEIHEAAGLAALADRDWVTAQAAYRRALELRPGDSALQAQLAYVDSRLHGRGAGQRDARVERAGPPPADHGRRAWDAPPPPPDYQPPRPPPEPPEDFWGRPPS